MWTMRTRHMLFGGTACLAVVLAAVAPTTAQTERRLEAALAGQVTSTTEGPMEGVVVTAKRHDSTIAVSVVSDADGRYRFPADRLQAGPHALSIRAVGYLRPGDGNSVQNPGRCRSPHESFVLLKRET